MRKINLNKCVSSVLALSMMLSMSAPMAVATQDIEIVETEENLVLADPMLADTEVEVEVEVETEVEAEAEAEVEVEAEAEVETEAEVEVETLAEDYAQPINSVNQGATNLLDQTDMTFKVEHTGGTYRDNYSTDITDYIQYVNVNDPSDPTVAITILTEEPVSISMELGVAVSPHRFVIADGVNANITFNDVKLARASSVTTGNHFDKNLIEVGDGATLNLTVVGDNVLQVKSWGGTVPTMNDVSKVTVSGAGNLTTYVPKYDTQDYESLGSTTVLRLENSSEFSGTSTMVVYDVEDGTATEDYFAEDFYFDSTTRTMTVLSGKTFAMGTTSGSYIQKIIIPAGLTEIPVILTKGVTSIPSASGSVFTINSDVVLKLRGNLTLANSLDADKPTIAGDAKVYLRGGYTLSVTTNAEIQTEIIEEEGSVYELVEIVPIGGNYFTVKGMGGATIDPSHVTYYSYKDGSSRTVHRLDIATSEAIEVTMHADYTASATDSYGAEVIFSEPADGKPLNVTFNNVTITQVNTVNGLTVNHETNLTLVGNNLIQIPKNFKWSSYDPAEENYLQIAGPDGSRDFAHLLTISGSGNMDVLTNTYINLDADSEITTHFADQVAAAVAAGGATGSVFAYTLADIDAIESELTLTMMDDASTLYKESYVTYEDAEYTGGVLYLKSGYDADNKALYYLNNVNIANPLTFQIAVDLDHGTEGEGIAPTTGRDSLGSDYALVYLKGINIANLGDKPGLVTYSDASFRLTAVNYINEDANGESPAIICNGNTEVVANSNLWAYINEGNAAFNIAEGYQTVGTQSSAGGMYQMVYSGNQAALDSGYSLCYSIGTAVSMSKTNWPTTPLTTAYEDGDFVYDEATGALTIRATGQVYLSTHKDNKTVTSDTLVIDPKDGGKATVLFNNVNINTSGTDFDQPLVHFKGNATWYFFDSTTNTIQPPYDMSNTNAQPTVVIDEGYSVNIIKKSGSMTTIYTRPNGVCIQGDYTTEQGGTLILQDIMIYATNGDALKDGDVKVAMTSSGTLITVYTDTPISLKNRDYTTPVDMRIEVPSNLGVVPNITLSGVYLTGTTSTLSAIHFKSSANLYLDGANQIASMSSATIGSIVVGQDGTNGVTLKIYATTSDATDKLTIAPRDHGANIEVTMGHTVEIYGGYIKLNPGQQAGSIGTSRYEGQMAHGDIYVYGGVVDAYSANNNRVIFGGPSEGGNVIIAGGTVRARTNYRSAGAVTAKDGSLAYMSFDLQNGARYITYVVDSTVASYTAAHHAISEITASDAESVAQWNGIRGRVANNYDSQTADEKEGVFTVYGQNVLQQDLTINPNETFYFYADNINVPGYVYVGDKNGVRDEAFADVNFSHVILGDGVSITNNGTVILPAYAYTNPHLTTVFQGDGTVNMPLTANLIQVADFEGTTGDFGYRGNSLFDYYQIIQNGESLVDVVDIELLQQDDVGNWDVIEGDDPYKIVDPGTYKVRITARDEEVEAVSVMSDGPSVETMSSNKFYYTGTAESMSFKIHASDLAGTDITMSKELVYNGSAFDKDDLHDIVDVYLVDGGVKLTGKDVADAPQAGFTPDYEGEFIGDFVNAGTDSLVYHIESNSNTAPTFIGENDLNIPIQPREIRDLLISASEIADLVFDPDNAVNNKVDLTGVFTFTYGAHSEILVEGKDFTAEFTNHGSLGTTNITITGMGNFTGTRELTYVLLGSIADSENGGSGTIALVDGVTQLEVGLAGRGDASKIVVTYDGNALTYGTDYILDYTVSNDKITVTATGIGSYIDSISGEFDCVLDTDAIEMIDPTKIYFKPDNTIEAYQIPIAVKDESTGDYIVLDYEEDKYTIELVFNEYGNKAIAYITVAIEPVDLGFDTTFVSTIETSFELDAVQAGMGTTEKVSEGYIHVVETVYARPDGVLHLLEDLVLEVGPTGDRTQLVKDEDYSIVQESVETTAGVTVYTVTVTNLKKANDSVTFTVQTGKAGEGTGTDIGKGIIDKVQPVAIPSLASIYTEIPMYIELIVDGITLENGVHYEIKEEDIEVTMVDGILKSDVAYVQVTALAGITGLAKWFGIQLVSANDQVSSDNLYIRPDYTINIDDIQLFDPRFVNKELVKGIDYVSTEPIWVDMDGDGIAEFKGIWLTYSDNFMAETGMTEQVVRFSVAPKDAGMGSSVAYGLIEIAEPVVRRPDNKLYQADIQLTIKGNDFTMGTDYQLDYVAEKVGEAHPSGDPSILTTTHEIKVQGLGTYGGDDSSNTFGIVALEPGSGTGNNFADGIIDLTTPIQKDEFGMVHPETDLLVEVDGQALEIDTDYTLTYDHASGSVTVTGMGSYTGSTTYVVSTSEYVAPEPSPEPSPEVSPEPSPEASKKPSTSSGTVTTDEEETETPEWENPFVDVDEDDWFYEDVKNNHIAGVVVGTTETKFEPYLGTSRGMVIQMIYNLEGKPETTFVPNFHDVAEVAWYADAVSWGLVNAVVKGISDELYAPDMIITREQLVTMLYRFLGEPTTTGDMMTFVDYEVTSPYAVSAMNWAVETGIVVGTNFNEVRPLAQASRAEVATVFNRFMALTDAVPAEAPEGNK